MNFLGEKIAVEKSHDGMMVDIDHTKKFSLVGKMKYA